MSGTVGGVCADWCTQAQIEALPCWTTGLIGVELFPIVIDWSTEILFNLSGQQWPGECTDTVRPCCPHTFDRCSCSCSCEVIDLGIYPVVEIVEIKIDNVAFTSFYLYDNRYLYRTDGNCWPTIQDLTKPTADPDTWYITLKHGYAPPLGGSHSAALLAVELAKACTGSEDCRLPDRVQSVTRQGVTATFNDPNEVFENGLTGLPEVDLWLSSLPNPGKYGPGQLFIPEAYKASVQRTT